MRRRTDEESRRKLKERISYNKKLQDTFKTHNRSSVGEGKGRGEDSAKDEEGRCRRDRGAGKVRKKFSKWGTRAGLMKEGKEDGFWEKIVVRDPGKKNPKERRARGGVGNQETEDHGKGVEMACRIIGRGEGFCLKKDGLRDGG